MTGDGVVVEGGDLRFPGLVYEMTGGSWTIFPGLCKGCKLCIEKCPTHSLGTIPKLGAYGVPVVGLKDEKCTKCGLCAAYCPDAAISVERQRREKTT